MSLLGTWNSLNFKRKTIRLPHFGTNDLLKCILIFVFENQYTYNIVGYSFLADFSANLVIGVVFAFPLSWTTQCLLYELAADNAQPLSETVAVGVVELTKVTCEIVVYLIMAIFPTFCTYTKFEGIRFDWVAQKPNLTEPYGRRFTIFIHHKWYTYQYGFVWICFQKVFFFF